MSIERRGRSGVLVAMLVAAILPAVIVPLVVLLHGCASHVVLERLPADHTGRLGPLHRCPVGRSVCEASPNQDESVFRLSGTTYFALPSCPYGIDRLMIEDADSSEPTVLVQCAAEGQEGIPTADLDTPVEQ
jgi:hypothetical protein